MWRDNLQQGKFRDALFYTIASDTTIGRRNARHEFALRDKPYIEDLGRLGKEYSFECYVYGDGSDYFAERDALIDALDKKGPGVLIHPFLGALTVSVVNARYRESSDQGGLATFSVVFAETDDVIAPAESTDSIGRITSAVSVVQAGSILDFAENFTVDGVASFVSNAAVEMVTDFTTEIAGFASFAGNVTSMVSGLPGSLADPTVFAGDVVGLVEQVSDAADLTELASFADDVLEPALTTASRIRQLANQNALISLVRTNAVGQLALQVTSL